MPRSIVAAGVLANVLITGLAVVATCGPAAAGEAEPPAPLFDHADLIDQRAAEAIERGMAYLVGQQADDGSFGTRGYGRNVAVCGLAGMAMLAAGGTPGRGSYGEPLDRCIDYLLENTGDDGLIVAKDAVSRGPMYGHGFATLFLCEAYGMAQHDGLRDRVGAAVELIVAAQNGAGGWRYTPEPVDADVSVTVCQVMALRAARNAGIAVPRTTIDRSIGYVRGCQNPDGGFRYRLQGARPDSGFARSAAGLVALYNAGIYEGDEIQRGLDYLRTFQPGAGGPAQRGYYFYGHYYAVQALWHAGGPAWRDWYVAVRDEIVARQRDDGSWIDAIGPEYSTAMACIILQTPNNYLPILQR